MISVVLALEFALLGPPSDMDILFPNGKEMTRLRVTVTSGGQSPEVAWRAFLNQLFAHFDRDGDGVLSKDEVERVVPLTTIGGETKPDFARMDADRNGKLSPTEFREFYRAAGFAPVVGIVVPPSVRSLEVAEALFAALDRDGDKTLSVKELKAALDLLRRFDENDDDELSDAELLSGWSGKASEAKSTLRVVPSEGKPDAVIQLVAGSPIDIPSGRLILAPEASPTRPLAARELVAEQFTSVGGKADKPVPKSAVEGVRTARALAAVFDAADRDGDANLTAAELTAFVDLVEAGAKCQVILELRDGGKSLFELFNRDGATLTRAELEQAAGFGPMTRADVVATYRLTYRRRLQASSFAGMPLINLPIVENPAEKQRPKSGPKWFLAMDRNGDGVVTRGEFVGRPERFASLDKDGDGRMTAAEAETASK